MLNIIDVGIGNVKSISNMFDFLEIDNNVVTTPDMLLDPTHLILPGVGSFDYAMKRLKVHGWIETFQNLSQDTKVLGICLGMQMLGTKSEEGSEAGLSLINLNSVKFPVGKLSVPNIGWNTVRVFGDGKLLKIDSPQRFYFSHSYYVESNQELDSTYKSNYILDYISGFEYNNFFGVQFHPEKSHKYGLALLKRFALL